jgi:xylulokinase
VWLRQLFGSPWFDELGHEAAAAPAGAGGLLVLPYFQGERTPILDPRARGVIAGLTISHTRGDLYRAALEGVALGVRPNLEALGGPPLRAVAVGGGATSALWPRIVSDVCGIPQELPVHTIGASFGDALLAAEAVGLVPARTSWTRADELLTPDASKASVYDELYGLYRDLYPSTSHVQHTLARMQIDAPSTV